MTTCTRLLFLGTLLAGLAGASAARAEEPPAFPAPPSGPLGDVPAADVPAAPTAEVPSADLPTGAPPSDAALPSVPAVAAEPPPPAPPEPPALDVVVAPPPAPPAPPASSVVDASAPGLCGTTSCCPQPCCDPCRRPSLDLQIHGAFMNGPEGPLTVPGGAPDEVVWDPLDYGMALGGRIAYHWGVGCGATATVGGTYWGAWEDEHTTVGTLNATDVPGGAPNISPVFTVQFEAEARLYGIEADISSDCVCTPCFRAGWGTGLRYMRFEEEGTFNFAPVGGPPVFSQGHAEVENGLLALQLCGHAAWRLGDRLELRARGAAFVGWLHQRAETSTVAFIPAGPADEDDSIGFGAELEIEARWRLNCNWSLGVGYGLLALFDQARVEQAFDLSQTATLVAPGRLDEDTVFAHRVFVGVTFDF